MRYTLMLGGILLIAGCSSTTSPESPTPAQGNLESGLVVPNDISPMRDAQPMSTAETAGNSSAFVARASAASPSTFFMTNYASGVRTRIPGVIPDPIRSVDGNTTSGVVALHGALNKEVHYIDNFRTGTWLWLADLPWSAVSIAGDNMYGPLAFGSGATRSIAFIRNYAQSKHWTILTGTAPIEIGAGTGDNMYGAVISGVGEEATIVYFLPDYSRPVWSKVSQLAPFPILGMTGDNLHGIVVYGNDNSGKPVRVAYISRYSGAWQEIANAPAPIVSMSGDNEYGPVILCSNGQTYYMASYASQKWEKIAAPAEACTGLIAGNNQTGTFSYCN